MYGVHDKTRTSFKKVSQYYMTFVLNEGNHPRF